MTADIRTAAEKEADRRYQDDLDGFEGLCPDAQEGFALGAVWAQARLTPTREQIAMTVAQFFGPDDTPEDVADAVLALMAGLAEGESSE